MMLLTVVVFIILITIKTTNRCVDDAGCVNRGSEYNEGG